MVKIVDIGIELEGLKINILDDVQCTMGVVETPDNSPSAQNRIDRD